MNGTDGRRGPHSFVGNGFRAHFDEQGRFRKFNWGSKPAHLLAAIYIVRRWYTSQVNGWWMGQRAKILNLRRKKQPKHIRATNAPKD